VGVKSLEILEKNTPIHVFLAIAQQYTQYTYNFFEVLFGIELLCL